ncbi:MAG: HEAT repeat domain-containing protein [Sedimentisphaerales bacterium]|nr:HEAT repeat domain-containing protein [Sedimentisphaerales bacterium]
MAQKITLVTFDVTAKSPKNAAKTTATLQNQVGKVLLTLASILISLFALTVLGCSSLSTGGISTEKLQQRTRRVLLTMLADDDPLLRVHTLESLALLPDCNVVPAIRESLNDPIPAVRFAASIAVGDIKDNASRNRLQQLVRDPNPSVQLAAGYALEKLGDRHFANWYDKILFSRDAKLAGQACMLIGKLGSTSIRKDSRAKLWRVLTQPDQSPAVQLQAAEALARLRDPKILKKLLVFAGSLYADDKLLAIVGLRHIGGRDVFAQMTVLAEDPQIEVKLSAIRALGKLAEKKQVRFVRNTLKYKDPDGESLATRRVRGLAVLALGSVGTDKDIRLLYNLMAETARNKYIRIAAARAVIDYLKAAGTDSNNLLKATSKNTGSR